MTDVIIGIAPPYALFSPGSGLPDVPQTGVSVTLEQEVAIRAKAASTGLNADYIVRLTEYGTLPDEPSVYVTAAYVEQQLARTILVSIDDEARPDTVGKVLFDTSTDPEAAAADGDYWVH